MSEAAAQKSNEPAAMVLNGARDISPKERKFDPIGMSQSRALMIHRDNPDVPKGIAIPYGWRLEVLLNGTPSTQPDFYVPVYVWTKRFVTRQPYYGATTSATPKTMVPSPRVGCLHIFDYCQVFNNDASTRTATIRITNGVTTINLVSQVIPPAETLFLQDGQWSVTFRGVAIPVAAGGTGLSTVPIGSLLYGQGTNPLATLAIGTAAQFLVVNAAAIAPAWVSMSGDATIATTGVITIANNAITTAKILNDAVTTAKILDANVTAAKLATDSVITAKILDANVTTAKIEVNERWLHNFLINDFRIAQRTVPTTLTIIADQGFGADRWKMFRENTDVRFRRYERGDAGSDFTGINAHAYARFDKLTTTGKFQVCQIIEAKDTSRLRGAPCTFRVKLRADAGGTARALRISIIEWTGTADTLTAAMISAWGANSVDPTLAASYARVATATAAVTTVATEFTVTGTPNSTANNLIVAITSDQQYASGQYIEVAEAVLALGALPRIWVPRLQSQERALCERFCVQFNSDATGTFAHIGLGDLSSTTVARFNVQLPVAMRTRPTSLAYLALSDFVISTAADGDAPTGLAINAALLEQEPRSVRIDATMLASSYVAGQAGCLLFSGVSGKYLRFDGAEL